MIKATDLFKPASPEELAKRKAAYPETMMMEELNSLKKTKLSDGTWHVHETLNIAGYEITTLKNLNISIIDRDFYCHYNKLTTLEGAPTTVNGSFCCSYNYLTSLEGAPTRVGGYFSCSDNRLTSLIGAPKEVGSHFSCYNNKKKFTEAEILKVCDVGIFTSCETHKE